MPKRQFSISLATKCQLLFGLAVIIIIAGALAVPWQRMEQLAGQQNVKAARMLADASLRQIHMQSWRRGMFRDMDYYINAETRWNDVSLLDLSDYPPPRIISLNRPDDPGPANDAFARDAIRMLRTRKGEREMGKVLDLPAPGGRIFRYAAAVRVQPSCIQCHGNWAPLLEAREGATTRARTTATTLPDGPATTNPVLMVATTRPVSSDEDSNLPLVAVVRVDIPWQVEENQLLLNRVVIVVAGLLGGTLAIIVFYLIVSRLILQPVRVLKSTASRVAKGDFNIRSAITTGDEFEQLSDTFNTMLSTIKASQSQLEATNRVLDSRAGELARLNVDLNDANRIKSDFLANVSHELRTPLNAILGFTDLVGEKHAEDPKTTRWMENIRLSAKQLLQLINDLLDLAKIESGKLTLRWERVNVGDLCETLANFMRPLALKKQQEIELVIQPDIPVIITDPGRLQQVVFNFLSNAIKFTPERGKVTLAASREGTNYVRISVLDMGPGIAPEFQQMIFEKFRQIESSHTRQHGGTGLGLAISKELTGLLEGHIELESTIGKGSVFSVILPLETKAVSKAVGLTGNTPFIPPKSADIPPASEPPQGL
jgi:two-component system sensor histidine kinase BarA